MGKGPAGKRLQGGPRSSCWFSIKILTTEIISVQTGGLCRASLFLLKVGDEVVNHVHTLLQCFPLNKRDQRALGRMDVDVLLVL